MKTYDVVKILFMKIINFIETLPFTIHLIATKHYKIHTS